MRNAVLPLLFPWSLSHSFPLSTLVFGPPGLAFQGSSSWQHPTPNHQVRGCCRQSVQPAPTSRTAPQFTCRREAALILVPRAFLLLAYHKPLLQGDWSASRCLPGSKLRLPLPSFARRGCPDTLSNALAGFRDLKKKKIQTLSLIIPEGSQQAQLKRDAKMRIFLHSFSFAWH